MRFVAASSNAGSQGRRSEFSSNVRNRRQHSKLLVVGLLPVPRADSLPVYIILSIKITNTLEPAHQPGRRADEHCGTKEDGELTCE